MLVDLVMIFYENKINEMKWNSVASFFNLSVICTFKWSSGLYTKELWLVVRSMRTETQPKMITSWNLAQMFFNIYRRTKKKSPTIPARNHLQIHNGGYSKIYENLRKWPKIDIIKNRWFGVHFKDNLILITFLLTHKVQNEQMVI